MSGTSMAVWLRRATLVLVGSGLAWRIVSLGMAEFYADQIRQNPAAAATALAWYPDYPNALRSLAAQLEGSDPVQAEALLARAWRGDPTDGDTLMRLARLWRKQGQAERADRACELAERLFPADARLRLQAADYWLAAGNPEKTVRNWDLAMQINPAAAPPLFPVLLNLANVPDGPAILAPIVSRRPPWWRPFFYYAIQNAAQVDTLRTLYTLRRAADQPIELAELDAYLTRLMREGLWAEAYTVWVNQLRPEQQQVLGYLYDGGFELTDFQGAFDWSASAAKSVQVTTHYTQLVTGKKALHVVLKGKSVPSPIVEQTVFLLPGHYRFSGRGRPDAVQAGAGLEWALDCVAGAGGRLATSERFLGSDLWRMFAVDFTVATDSCAGVRLSLQPVAHLLEGGEAKGEIWFDDLAIRLVDSVADESPRGGPAPMGQKKSLPTGGDTQTAGRPRPRTPPAKTQANRGGAGGTAADRPGTDGATKAAQPGERQTGH